MEIGTLDVMSPQNGGRINTLVFHPGRCVRCGMCLKVCPHRVVALEGERIRLARPADCMECGACRKNCPSHAIEVDSGVGCASAMIKAALRGREDVVCGEDCCR